MSKKPELSKELLEELLDYDPETGVLTWKERGMEWFSDERHWRTWNSNNRGKEVGTPRTADKVHLGIGLFGTQYRKLPVIWLLHYGKLPATQLMLLDGDHRNTKIGNIVERGRNNVEKAGWVRQCKAYPTMECLLSVFDYNPDTGVFKYKESVRGRMAGKEVKASPTHRYASVVYRGQRYYVHRLIYVMMTGCAPPQEVDHINGNKCDNRWINLRAATPGQNRQNRPPTGVNAAGYKGVFMDNRKKGKKRYYVQVMHQGKRHFSRGGFTTPEDASTAATKLRNELHKEYANHG